MDLSMHFRGQAQSQLILSQIGPVPKDKVSKNLVKSIPKTDWIILVWLGVFLGKQD